MRLDQISNKVIRGQLGVTSIEDKIKEVRLTWFEDIRRRSMDASVRRYEKLDCPNHKRSRGRPRKSWSEVIRHDLEALGLVEDMVQDIKLWRSRIKVVDSK